MNDISPMTETEMRAFFERLASTFVAMSAQAKTIEELQRDIGIVSDRVSRIAAEKERIERELYSKVAECDNLRVELESAKANASEANDLAQSYSNDLNNVKATLENVRDSLEEYRKANVNLYNERDEAHRDTEKVKDQLTHSDQLLQESRDRNGRLLAEIEKLRQEAHDREASIEQLQLHTSNVEQKLATIRQSLG